VCVPRKSGTKAGALAAVTLAAAALACGRSEPAPAPGPPAQAEPAPAAAPAPAAPGRGDRHARAAARKRAEIRQLTGVIARVDEGWVAIRPRGGAPVTLHVGRATAVTLDGRRCGTEALRPGADVRASYRSGGGAPATALTIDARGDAPVSRPDRAAPPPANPPATTGAAPPLANPPSATDAAPPSDG
jgi:hypothetical protein